jgi:hypothetical protein
LSRVKTLIRGSILVLLIALAVPVPAIQVPQTRREFVEAVNAGARSVKKEVFVVEQGFDEVYTTLQRKSTKCLDVQVKRSGFVGNQMEVSSSDYNPTLRKVARGKAEFALQVVHRPSGVGATIPPGGLYVMAADIRSVGNGRTEIVLYRPTMGYKDITRSLRDWAAGEDVDCPKLK